MKLFWIPLYRIEGDGAVLVAAENAEEAMALVVASKRADAWYDNLGTPVEVATPSAPGVLFAA